SLCTFCQGCSMQSSFSSGMGRPAVRIASGIGWGVYSIHPQTAEQIQGNELQSTLSIGRYEKKTRLHIIRFAVRDSRRCAISRFSTTIRADATVGPLQQSCI